MSGPSNQHVADVTDGVRSDRNVFDRSRDDFLARSVIAAQDVIGFALPRTSITPQGPTALAKYRTTCSLFLHGAIGLTASVVLTSRRFA